MDYVIIAEFKAQPGKAEEFINLLEAHSEHSRNEPGCKVFDVSKDADDPETVLLYEVYQNPDAFSAHQKTPHYARFIKNLPDMVVKQGEVFFVSRRVLNRVWG